MLILLAALLFLYAWAVINPLLARTIMAELKRRWRLYLIQRGGEHAVQVAAQRLTRLADRKHIEPHIVHEVLAARRLEMIERLGRRYADQVLGEPTPLERYF